MTCARDDGLIDRLGAWFAVHARSLPWRDRPHGRRDPYLVLVSEIMLQQTQVSRVAERYPAFIARFPTVAALAAAAEDDVLAAWSGMGYYRRARLLQAAARAVVEQFGDQVPRDAATLRSLPGVGPYTAGAVASMAFNAPEPVVDGNVVRVLLRLRGKHGAADDRDTVAWCWDEARRLVQRAAVGGGITSPAGGHTVGPGLFNEALMELGATVCTPRSPRCEACPLAASCKARVTGTQTEIPRPKQAATRRAIHLATVVIRDVDGRTLLEQRPARGLWARLWQAPTAELHAGEMMGAAVGRMLFENPPRVLTRTASLAVQTTHREVLVTVFAARPPADPDALLAAPVEHPATRRRWVNPDELASVGLANWQKNLLMPGGLIA